MRKIKNSLCLLLLGIYASNGFAQQVKIGDNTSVSPLQSSALLQLESTTRGFLLPRITTVQRDAIATPATGLIVYNTTTASFQYYDGAAWQDLNNMYTVNGTIGTNRTIGVTDKVNFDNNTFVIDGTNNRIGIGTNTPGAQLHTTGSVLFAGAGTPGAGKILTSDATGNATWENNTALSTTLPNTYLFVGNGSGIATGVAMSGDATISNTGVLTIGNNAITSAKITNGTIANTDLAVSVGGIYKGNGNLSAATTVTQGTNGLTFSGSGYLNKQSGAAGVPSVFTWGRTATEAELGVAGASGNGFPTAAAGDVWVKSNSSTGSMFVGTQAAATLKLMTNNTERFSISSAGVLNISNMSGSGSRMVVADASGNLSTQAYTSGTVTSVTGTAPISVATGTSTPVISLNDGGVTSAKIEDGTITTSDISGTAGITNAQLANSAVTINGTAVSLGGTATITASPVGTTLTSGNILVGNSSDVAAAVALSGDATISNTGALTIGTGAVTSTKILDGTIATADMADAAVTTAKIADGTITTADLNAAAGITNAQLANSSVTINGNVVSLGGTATITASPVGTSLTSGNILVGNASNAAAAVALSGDATISNTGALTIGTGAVTSTKILDGTIATADMADAAVTTAKIADGTITTADLNAAAGITNAQLANSAVTINGNVVSLGGTATITASPVGTTLTSGNILVGNSSDVAAAVALSGDATISNTGALTIGTGAVTSTKILDGTIAAADIASDAVTTAKIANSNVTSAKLENNITLPGTANMTFPSGTTAQRPATPANGMMRYNTTTAKFEMYQNGAWVNNDTGTTYSAGTGITLAGTTFSHTAHTGDVTGSGALTIANDAVTTAKIADGTITTADLNAAAGITNAQLANSAVTINGNVVSLGGSATVTASQVTSSAIAASGTQVAVASTNVQGAISDLATAVKSASNSTIYNTNGTIGSGRTVAVTDNVNFDSNTFVIDGTNNRIGIGTSTPAYSLDIAGQMRITGNIYPHLAYNNRLTIGEVNPPANETGSVVSFGSNDVNKNILFAFTKTLVNTSFLGNDGSSMIIGEEGPNPIIFKNGLSYSSANILASGTERFRINGDGTIKIGNLAGTGSRMVVADATGNLSTQAFTSGTVTSVTGTAPISVATGTSTPVISLNDGGVTSAKIEDGAVTVAKLPAGATATTFLRGDGTWVVPTDNNTTYSAGTGLTLAGTTFSHTAHTGDVTGSGALTIANDVVTSAKIANGTITTSDISGTAGITNAQLANSTVTINGTAVSLGGTATITASPVGTSLISGNILVGNASGTAAAVAVSGDATLSNAGVLTIGAGAITSGKIFDGTIATADLADAVVTTAKIADGAVATADIAANAVTVAKLPAGATGTTFLRGDGTWVIPTDNNTTYSAGTGLTLAGTTFSHTAHTGDVTGSGALTIANDAVTSAKIANGTITTTDISGTAGITNAQLANSAVTINGTAISLGGTATITASPVGTTLSSGNILVGNASGAAAAVAVGGDATLSNAGALTIGTGAITSAKIADGTITNTDISGTAGITNGQLANSSVTINGTAVSLGGTATITASPVGTTLSSGNILVGNASGAAAAVAVGGDATLSNAGVLTIGAGAITSGKIFDGTIATADLADAVVTTAKIADGAVATADIAANAVTVAKLPAGATGTTFLRGDGTWVVPTDNNTTYSAGTGLTLTGTTFSHTAHTGDVTGSGALTIANDAVTSAKIANGTITTTDISGTAGITNAQLANSAVTINGTAVSLGGTATITASPIGTTLSSGNILVGNASGAATAVAVSGDATLSNAGALTIGAGAVTSTKILDGTIANTDLASGAGGIYKGSGSLSASTSITQGTNTITFNSDTPSSGFNVTNSTTDAGLVYSNVGTFLSPNLAMNQISILKIGKALSNGNAGDITYRYVSDNNAANALSLGFHMTGALWTIQNNGNVGIGTTTPAVQLHTTGSVRFAGAGTPGVGKVLMSDASGNATWETQTALSTSLGSAKIYVGNSSGIATGVDLTGDATLTNTGSFTLNDGSISTSKIFYGAVTSEKIADGTIETADLKDLAITEGKVANSCITTNKIADGTITSADINSLAGITNAQLANSSVTINGNTVNLGGSTTIAATPIGTTLASSNIVVGNASNIATAMGMSGDASLSNTGALTISYGAVTSSKIADGTIETADILDGTVLNADLASGVGGIYKGSGSLSGTTTITQGANNFNLSGTGNVGIGTTIPSSKLSVVSNNQGGGAADDIEITSYQSAGTASPTFYLRASRGTEAAPVNLQSGDMIGTLTWNGRYNGGFSLLSEINSTYKGNGTTALSTMNFVTSGSYRMTIDETGEIGIGTTIPTAQLHTTGTILFAGAGTPGAGKVLTSDASGYATWQNNAALSTTLNSARIFVGNGFNIATGVAMSGDATINNTGAITIGTGAVNSLKILDGTITTTDISATAGITNAQLANSTVTINGNVVSLGGSATVTASQVTSTAIAASGTQVAVASTNVQGAISDLATAVKSASNSTIYNANGTIGSGRTVAVTDNVNFDNNTFVIDGTNNRLGVGTDSPSSDFTIAQGTGALTSRGIRFTGNAVDGTNLGSGFTMVLGYNQVGNKQLWLGDPEYLGDATKSFIRFNSSAANGPLFDAVNGTNSSRMPLAFGIAGDPASGIILGGDLNGYVAPTSFVWVNENMSIGTGYKAYEAPVDGLIVKGNVGIGTDGNTVNSKLEVVGSIALPIRRVTAATALGSTDHTLLCNATTAGFTVTLPAANTCANRIYVIRKSDETNNAITLSIAVKVSETTSITSFNTNRTLRIQSDGTSWWVIE